MSGLDAGYELIASPATHPGLADAAVRAELADRWRRDGQVRIAPLLAPGLAAELAVVTARLPFQAVVDAAELSWRCTIEVPRHLDPQNPTCLYRMVRLLELDLPELIAAITGHAWTCPPGSQVPLRAFRLGSYRDPAPRDGDDGGDDGGGDVAALIGVTALPWPEAWGGHLELLGDDGAVVARRPPVADGLDLFRPGRLRIPLVTRAVEAVVVDLAPAGARAAVAAVAPAGPGGAEGGTDARP